MRKKKSVGMTLAAIGGVMAVAGLGISYLNSRENKKGSNPCNCGDDCNCVECMCGADNDVLEDDEDSADDLVKDAVEDTPGMDKVMSL